MPFGYLEPLLADLDRLGKLVERDVRPGARAENGLPPKMDAPPSKTAALPPKTGAPPSNTHHDDARHGARCSVHSTPCDILARRTAIVWNDSSIHIYIYIYIYDKTM